jgi:hypothetical protein
MLPHGLTDAQLDRLMSVADAIPVASRDKFLREVARRVCCLPIYGDAEIERAISVVLGSLAVRNLTARAR